MFVYLKILLLPIVYRFNDRSCSSVPAVEVHTSSSEKDSVNSQLLDTLTHTIELHCMFSYIC